MRLPKTLCVKWSNGDPPYYVVDTDIGGMVDMNEKVQIGVYRLVETKTIEGIVEVSNKRTVKLKE